MVDKLAHNIHERFCGNRGFAATTCLHTDSLYTGGLATQPINVLMGTGALLPGAYPRSESNGTGTAADGGASPLSSARSAVTE